MLSAIEIAILVLWITVGTVVFGAFVTIDDVNYNPMLFIIVWVFHVIFWPLILLYKLGQLIRNKTV